MILKRLKMTRIISSSRLLLLVGTALCLFIQDVAAFGVPAVQKQQQQCSSRTQPLGFASSTVQAQPPPYPVRITVMGGGNFGLALATICARNGMPTTLLVRNKEIADYINTKHQHPKYMANFTFPKRIRATSDPKECLPDATYIIHAVPCQYSRQFLTSVASYIPPGTPVLSVSKGIETTSLGFMADILKDCLGDQRAYAFLSGPSFAREICEGVATGVVIASEDLDLARDLATLLSDGNFRCFISKDVVGVEIGGAVKNVIAIAAGMCEGLGLGTNAMSGLVTRGCGEMRRLGLTFGARSSTISGLSGMYCINIYSLPKREVRLGDGIIFHVFIFILCICRCW